LSIPFAPTEPVARTTTFRAEFQTTLEPGEERVLPFCLLVSNEGMESAQELLFKVRDWKEAYEQTKAYVSRVLAYSDLACPDPVITRGVRWAKANILRVQERYPAGWGFTNNPPSDILVLRDAAWFILGSDYVTPDFSRRMLRTILRYGMEIEGKWVERLSCGVDPPRFEDYGLPINDNTPLVLQALYHHFAVTGDTTFLSTVYPVVERTARYILSLRKEGLIYGLAPGTGVWGIISWRNRIPRYNLTGFVTEINAECYAALRYAARIARILGRDADAERFQQGAEALRARINEKLLSPRTGLYYLHRDSKGQPVEDLTGDVIFPVLFGVAPEPVSERILDRIKARDFWTEWGVRTIPEGAKFYHPQKGFGLRGGIWPNLTLWVAYAAGRKGRAEDLIRGLRQTYRLGELESPESRKVVPGQFPEWLDGERFVNRGAKLSPWVASIYLWAAVEALAGVDPTSEPISLQPSLPEGWSWIALKNLPIRGNLLSFVFYEDTLYSSLPVQSSFPVRVFDRDLSAEFVSNAFVLAFQLEGKEFLFVASPEGGMVQVWDQRHRRKVVEDGFAAGEARLMLLNK